MVRRETKTKGMGFPDMVLRDTVFAAFELRKIFYKCTAEQIS